MSNSISENDNFPRIINYNREDIEPNAETIENSSPNNETSEIFHKNVIACILWKNGKMGAAYYKITDQQLYFVQEVIDLQPYFGLSCTLLREMDPLHIITIGGKCDIFPKFLISNLTFNENTNESVSLNTDIPENLSILRPKEYSYEACEYFLTNLKLVNEPSSVCEENRQLFTYSLIDIDSKISVHALGALLKFMEKHWSQLNVPKGSELIYLNLKQACLLNQFANSAIFGLNLKTGSMAILYLNLTLKHLSSDQILMDKSTFDGLQIFQSCGHEAGFKRWTSSNREGHSIYKIFSQHCKSFLGLKCLRNMLCTPIKNIEILNNRLDFVEFISDPKKQGFSESLQDNMKHITDVNELLKKIKFGRATFKEWEKLHEIIYHIIFFNELCIPYKDKCVLFQELFDNISDKLYDLQHTINGALDFSTKTKSFRPIIKFGLDQELDAKKLRRQDIAKHVTAAANIAVDRLPDFLNECSIVYVPQIGHLIAVKNFSSTYSEENLSLSDFHFMFEIHEIAHYKNALCVELDRHLGEDLQQDIMAHETRIIQRLSEFVITYSDDIRKPLHIIATIDCLMSVAQVSKEHSYIKPTLNNSNIHEIKDGRHPLLEITGSNCVPNDFQSGSSYSHVKIITGPNDSGKSIYLKQVALIVYLAHIGFYVPAKEANISMVHGIFSRIQSNESAVIDLSAFMLDLTQMAQAIYNAKSTSLVIVDEFGTGTDEDDGVSLLTVALKNFLDQNEHCPHVLVSTHFQKIRGILPSSPLVEFLKMDYSHENEQDLVFLYKVVEGISRSFGFAAAYAILGKDIVNRANKFYRVAYDNQSFSFLNVETDLELEIPELDY